MADDLLISNRFTIPGSELLTTASLSGGAGGQHVNKTNSKITLKWNLVASPSLGVYRKNQLLKRLGDRLSKAGDLIVTAESHRSQKQDIDAARQKLRGILQEALKPVKKRRPTQPSRSAKKKRLDSKKKRGHLKSNRQKPRLD